MSFITSDRTGKLTLLTSVTLITSFAPSLQGKLVNLPWVAKVQPHEGLDPRSWVAISPDNFSKTVFYVHPNLIEGDEGTSLDSPQGLACELCDEIQSRLSSGDVGPISFDILKTLAAGMLAGRQKSTHDYVH